MELEDYQGLGQKKGADEGRRKIGRGRETRKGGRLKQREKECIAVGLCHPEGEVMVFVVFFLKSVAPGDPRPGRVVEWSLVVPHSGRGFTKVQRIKLIRL